MNTLRLILGDQLNRRISSLSDLQPENDVVLLAEVQSEASYAPHHKKKLAFIFSSMRHFAKELHESGIKLAYCPYSLDYCAQLDTELTAPFTTQSQSPSTAPAQPMASLEDAVAACITPFKIDRVVVSQPAEYRLLKQFEEWEHRLGIPVEIRADNRFLVSQSFFTDWARGRKQLRMEYFYREMRKQSGLLMDGKEPVGGQWNFDAQNRKKLPKNTQVPAATTFPVDPITQEVIDMVNVVFANQFGSLSTFHYATTRQQALTVLGRFIKERLFAFGDYQDAMAQSEPWMFHSHISFYLNNGLLFADEVVEQVEAAYHRGEAPLNAVEGFIRQVIGWREFVRGFYWYLMPDYRQENYLSATRPLPDWFWTGDTKMNCLKQCISETQENAYAHHIQRLMVIGNFALLAGLSVDEVNQWYLSVYADAYEWVELPNVSGMVLFADGGKLASKPYAASGSYINKMSDYCQNCVYKVKDKVGPTACPFNYLYWNFLITHQQTLSANPRMGMIYKTLNKMDASRLQDIESSSDQFFANIETS